MEEKNKTNVWYMPVIKDTTNSGDIRKSTKCIGYEIKIIKEEE